MSKEGRIQEQVAEKLGFRVFLNEEDSQWLVRFNTAVNAVPQSAMSTEVTLWEALIAAEAKLEPQTVAEPIDWRQYAIGLDNAYTSWDSEARALAQQAQDEDAATDFMVGKITEWLKSFVQRIHSSVPDTKGLEEQIAKRVESWATGSNTHVSTVFAIARDIRNAYGLPTDTPAEAE